MNKFLITAIVLIIVIFLFTFLIAFRSSKYEYFENDSPESIDDRNQTILEKIKTMKNNIHQIKTLS